MSDLTPEQQALVLAAVRRFIAATHCIACGREVIQFVQVGRSCYAEPCGCRQGQMKAAAMNRRRAETLEKQEMTTKPDLDALLQRLADMNEEAQERYEQEQGQEEGEREEYEPIWFSLEQYGHHTWRCGWRVRPDEATEWAIKAEGRTPVEAAVVLRKLMENSP